MLRVNNLTGFGGKQPVAAAAGFSVVTTQETNSTTDLDTYTATFTVDSTSNVIIVRIGWEGSDTTPTITTLEFNAVTMAQHGLDSNSRTASVIGVIVPSSTGSQTCEIVLEGAARNCFMLLEEWSGVDTTTPVNNSNSNSAAGATTATANIATTTDDGSKLLGICSLQGGDHEDVLTATTGIQSRMIATGSNVNQDNTNSCAYKDIVTGGGSEDIIWDWAADGGHRFSASIIELNPA